MTINILAQIPLFSDLPRTELEHLLAVLERQNVKSGEILFREGEPGEHMYVVLDGELEVLMAEGQPEELLLKILHSGEYLGEMSLILPNGERTASVRAHGPATLLCISRSQFLDLLKRYPLLANSMVQVLSERLDATNTATFRDLTEKNRQLQQAYDDLKAAQALLIEKERLERELQLAAEIQLSILPDELPLMDGFDFGACMLPARQVGGDFYDVFQISENRIGILIGDVSDKGVPAALFMARTHALIMAEADRGANPAEVMATTNRHLTRLQKSTQFVTVLYGILDIGSGVFIFARAGHEPPLLLNPDGSVIRLPHGPGMSLGLWEPITVDEQEVRLPPNSTLLLYTDGMTDCRNQQGEAFSLERIHQKLGTTFGMAAQQICDQMLNTLKTHQNGAKQDDDVTLVAIHSRNNS
jgi:serine phosphatase RsbU (regulator of sigma subunit)